MKFNKNIKYTLASLSIAFLAGSFMTSCRDEFGLENGPVDLGRKVEGVLSVPLGSSSPVTASRAVDFSADAMVKIDSYWIGVFDAETHELLGTKYDTHPRKSDGTRWTLRNNNETPFTVDDIKIEYYEKSPYAYIVGVVNFNDVMAKQVGETAEANDSVITLLKKVKKFEDLSTLVIDTPSADKANRDRGSDYANPIMMGYFSTGMTVTHPTINPDGSLYVDDSNRAQYDPSFRQPKDEIRACLTGSGVDLDLSGGAIRLKRLLSEVNMYIYPANFESDSYYDSNTGYYNYEGANSYISGVRYKVINKPQDVFLLEHALDTKGAGRTSKSDYLANTANSADHTDNFLSDEGWQYANWARDSYTGKDVYIVSYQHYENKHYGTPWWWDTEEPLDRPTDHFLREKRFSDATSSTGLSSVYRSLSPSVDQPWNNSASYVVLEVSIDAQKYKDYYTKDPNISNWYCNEWEELESQNGKVYYIIHEGYTRSTDGSYYGDYDMLDYQTLRNTQYHYLIKVGGADGLKMNVTYNDMDEPENRNDGIYGEVGYSNKITLENTEHPIFRPIGFLTNETRKNLKWIYYQYTPNAYNSSGTSQYYGNWSSSDGTLYYDSYEGYIDVSKITNPLEWGPDKMPEYGSDEYELISQLLNSVYVTKSNSWDILKEGIPKYEPGDEEIAWDKFIPLVLFIDLEDDDPFLKLEPGEQFYYAFAPYLITSSSDMNYEKMEQYKRQFFIIEPERGNGFGPEESKLLGNTMQFIQGPYDDRMNIYSPRNEGAHMSYFGEYYHDRDWFDYYDSENGWLYTYWCGAPGTVTWFYIRQEFSYEDNEKEVPDYEFNIGGYIYNVSHEDIKVVSTSSYYKYLMIPVYIPTYHSGYGYNDIRITMKHNPKKYKFVETVNSKNYLSYSKGFFMQRKRTSGTGSWQWLFSDVSESTYGYGKIWQFYNNTDHMYNTSFEFGGLTVINGKGTSESSRKAIATAKIRQYNAPGSSGEVDDVTQVDCLSFGGGYGDKAPSYRSSDAMMLRFWVDRPGDIYLSYGYGGTGSNREWRAYWRGFDGYTTSSTYLRWENDPSKVNMIVPEVKGLPSSGSVEDFWPETGEDGRFVNGPVEVCIYMASSAGYIRSIEFNPWYN